MDRLLEPLREAAASLGAHPLRSALGGLSVAVAVATIVLVITALDGLADYARTTTARTFGSDTFLIAQVAAAGQLTRRELAEKLERNPAVTPSDVRFLEQFADSKVLYAANVERRADVAAGARLFENATITGTSATLPALRELAIQQGRFFTVQEEQRAAAVAVIGADIAERLFPMRDPIGQRIRLGGRAFEVIGLQQRLGTLGGQSLDRQVYVPRKALERLFGPQPTLLVFASATPGVNTTEAEDRARVSMRARRRRPPGTADNFDILTPDAARGFVEQVSQRVGAAAGPISFMALLAAMVVVANTMLVSVTERTREIGVRRAVGARRSDVARAVVVEAALLGLAGGIAGALAAVVVVTLAGEVLPLEVSVRPSAVGWGLAASLLAGLASGWYPARRATRMDVIAAIRTE
jgi:putative ABC transport system permease protein